MKWSISLGKPFGIKLKIHWTFFLILIYVAYLSYNTGGSFNDFISTSLFVLAIFACVVLHEFGHALTARRFNIKTRQIILLPIGGLAQLEAFPKKPIQEFIVAIAGPLVNVAIALVLFIALFLLRAKIPGDLQAIAEGGFMIQLILINIILFLFNLIPAFPMDGGRVLRALLATNLEYVKATEYAARVGQFFAILFAIVGLFYNPILIFIALFIYLGAEGEATMVKARNLLEGYRVKDAMLTRFTTLTPNDTLQDAVNELLAGSEKDFIILEDNQVAGVLPRETLVEALSNLDRNHRIKEVMRTDFPSARSYDSLEDTVNAMRSTNFPILPVYEDNDLIGAISLDNITELFLIRRPDADIDKQVILNAK